MQNRKNYIGPNSGFLCMIIVCILISVFLLATGYKGNLPTSTHPLVPLVLGIGVLISNIKWVCFSETSITIRRVLPCFNSILMWSDVHHIEVSDAAGYIFIALHDCPTLSESRLSAKSYRRKMRNKVIEIIFLTKKQRKEYIDIIEGHYRGIVMNK